MSSIAGHTGDLTTGRAVGRVVGLDVGHGTVEVAEHWLHEIVRLLGHPAGLVACTHLVHEPHPHVALSLYLPPAAPSAPAATSGSPLPAALRLPAPLAEEGAPPHASTVTGAPSSRTGEDPWPPEAEQGEGAARAAAEHEARIAGRALYYRGHELLTGSLTVAEVLSRTAIERVVMMGGAEAPPGTTLHTLDYVRPMWKDGRLTLVTRPAPAGALVPFELKNPTPCCADH
jgi:hypothetical protein